MMFRLTMPCNRLAFSRTRFAMAAVTVFALTAMLAACDSGQSDPAEFVIPSPTVGPLTGQFTPKITDAAGVLSVEVFVGWEGYTQQGTATISDHASGTGTELRISVRPAQGLIQLASLREGTCDEIGKWLTSVEQTIGGESISELTEYSLSDLFNGNHVITLSFPGGGINEVSTCGEFPEIDIDGLRQ